MANTKGQLMRALVEGDDPDGLVCFYQNSEGEPRSWGRGGPPVLRCSFSELPERVFDASWGGTEGEPCIAFSDRYVYIKIQYTVQSI